MPFRLVSTDGDVSFELRPGASLVLGRALSSDLPVLDPTVSRRHAELVADAKGVALRDLASSNGTFVNGARVETTRVAAGDAILFGKVGFEVRELSSVLIDDASAERMRRTARAGTTIMRQIPVPDADQALERAIRASGVHRSINDTTPALPQHERDRLKLSLLLEVSKALTRAKDREALLERIVGFVFRLLEVDRASILLCDDDGGLVPVLSRSRAGEAIQHVVPREIARTAILEKVAILSDNAPDAAITGSGGESTRSAVCAPLIGGEGRILGVLYVDTVTSSYRVSDEDLDFLVAFAGIGAVAIDNLRFADRSRHEALVRGNFERFFTPHMAARIAESPEAVQLGGERRTVAVLFSDIRGFTEIAAGMAPDETARMLTEYFTEMVECVFRHGGTLDKFIGDAVMAQWGAPISEPDDADRALEAAIEMLSAVRFLNDRWRAQGRPEIQVGLGLNYGEAFAGNIGSERRLEYTVIGDTVNTASRLCSWADGGEIVVSESLRAALTREFALIDRPPLALRGKSELVPVFRVAP